MQDGFTPAYKASQNGHAEILALLLANKVDINAANEVQQFTIFKYLYLIENELQVFNIAFFISSTILAHENMKYYSTWFTLVLYAEWYYPGVCSFPTWTH
jgi:hypothetical protein